MAEPLLQAQIEIDAPVTKVWSLVSDLSRMPQWSPQCRLMKTLGGPLRQGSRTINLNRRKYLIWPTTSRITEFIPDKKLAFRVNENGTVWSYELEPTDTGTRLTETRHAENGVSAFSNMSVNALMGGVPSFERELVDGYERVAVADQGRGRKLISRLGEVQHAVVVRIEERRTGAGRLRRIRMCAAAVLGVDHLAVGGHLVGAHAEHQSQRP